MKRLAYIILFSLFLSSCASFTEDFVAGPAYDSSLSLEEKLISFGAEHVTVPYPETYFDGTEWLGRITGLIGEAEDYILISTFLGSSSESLDGMYDALIDASLRGVDIYFIIDGISSYDMTETRNHMTQLYFLRDYGINLLEYSPLSATRLLNPSELVIRDHRKLFVIDGELAAIGGMNMNYISMGAGEGKTQRDSMYLFRSPSLSEALMKEFVDIWNRTSVEEISYDDFPIAEENDGIYDAYLLNMGSDSISGMYASLFASASRSVLIFPYLPVLDDNMKKCLSMASGRGVDITMVMPIDLRGYAAGGVYYFLPDLLATGITVYSSTEDEEGNELPLLHEKLMIVDDRYVVIGSSNFNYRSMGLSHELALVIDSRELAEELEEHARMIMKGSHLYTMEEAERLKKEQGNLFSYLFMYYGG